MKLTEHFTDYELGVAGCEQRLIDNATFLCKAVLEPLRVHFGQPVNVHDGYRDLYHNAAVGGKINSWHLFDGGHAAVDIDVEHMSMRAVFDWLRLQSGLPFDKVIMETDLGIPRTIHIQTDAVMAPRRLAYVGGTGDAKDYSPVLVA